MITLGINLLIVSILVLIIGMIKPKWILFFLDTPQRIGIVMIASVIFMAGLTFFSEGVKQKKERQNSSSQPHDSEITPTEPKLQQQSKENS